jgi:hypothetical protein
MRAGNAGGKAGGKAGPGIWAQEYGPRNMGLDMTQRLILECTLTGKILLGLAIRPEAECSGPHVAE